MHIHRTSLTLHNLSNSRTFHSPFNSSSSPLTTPIQPASPALLWTCHNFKPEYTCTIQHLQHSSHQVISVVQEGCVKSVFAQQLPGMTILVMILCLLFWMITFLAWKEWSLHEFNYFFLLNTSGLNMLVHMSTGWSVMMINLIPTQVCGLCLRRNAVGSQLHKLLM